MTLLAIAATTDQEAFDAARPAPESLAEHAWLATDTLVGPGYKARPMWLALRRDAAEAAIRLQRGDVLVFDTFPPRWKQ